MDYGKPPVAVGSGTLVAAGTTFTDLLVPFIITAIFGFVAMTAFRLYWRRGLSLGE